MGTSVRRTHLAADVSKRQRKHLRSEERRERPELRRADAVRAVHEDGLGLDLRSIVGVFVASCRGRRRRERLERAREPLEVILLPARHPSVRRVHDVVQLRRRHQTEVDASRPRGGDPFRADRCECWGGVERRQVELKGAEGGY
eukprot:30907-Pelagococcus_subviridis.AAC.4